MSNEVRRSQGRAGIASAICAVISLSVVHSVAAASPRCIEHLRDSETVLDREWDQRGGASVSVPIPVTANRDLLIEVEQHGIGIEVAGIGDNGAAILAVDYPVEREGPEYAYLSSRGPLVTSLTLSAKESERMSGSVRLVVRTLPADTAAGQGAEPCRDMLRSLAAADASYQKARAIEIHGSQRPAEDGATAHRALESAVRSYASALEILSALHYPRDKGETELALAAVSYYELQDWEGSAEWAAKAAQTFAAIGEDYLEARAQAILAAAWMEMATRSDSPAPTSGVPMHARETLDKARALLRHLASFHFAHGQRYDASLQVNNIGVAYIYEARFERAIGYLTRARSAFETVGDTAREATALQNLAICEWGLGRLSVALPQFDRALSLIRPSPYPDLYLLALNNSGLAHYAAGRLDESLRLQAQALDFATLSQSQRARARSFYGIGVAYYAIGDRQLAQQFLRGALDIVTPELDARMRVATLRAMAVIEHEQGKITEAIAHNSEALSLATAPSARSRILLRLALDMAAHGDQRSALRSLADLIAHPPEGDRLVQATARVERGAVRRKSGDLAGAESDLRQGLRTLRELDSLADRFDAQVELAHVYDLQKQPALALATIRDALRVSPEIRAETSNPEYRAAIGQSLRPAVDFEIELLRKSYERQVALHENVAARRTMLAALRVADESRAQVFESWRAQHLTAGSDARLAKLADARDGLYRDMAERRFQLSTREDRGGADDLRARLLREDLARLRVRLGVINAELLKRATLPETAVSASSGAESDWRARFAGLEPGHVLIEYWLGSEHAYAWTATRDAVTWVSLVPSRDIDQAARTLHQMLRTADGGTPEQRLSECALLHQLLLAPLRDAREATDVTIVPDGPLDYIPFAALRDERQQEAPYWTQRAVISIAPALRFLGTHSQNDSPAKGTSRMLLVADPVYGPDDPRVPANLRKVTATAALPGLLSDAQAMVRLPSTAQEANEIRRRYGTVEVDTLEGLDATRDNLLARNLGSYRFIHIASHGEMDAEVPELSALVLGKFARTGQVTDQYVRAGDLLGRTFNAQAIVLSACDTALGKEYASEGLVGLRYVALARGAHAVVASLWAVSDGITADLMTYMYGQIKAADSNGSRTHAVHESEMVAMALTGAMRHVIGHTPSLDPALWAPFSVYVAGD